MSDSERIQAVLTHLQMNTTQFSEAIGRSSAAIQYILSGRNKISATTAKLIVTKFNVNFEWLMTGKGEMINSKLPPDMLRITPQTIPNPYSMPETEKEKDQLISTLMDIREKQERHIFNLLDNIEDLRRSIRDKEKIIECMELLQNKIKTG